jgi:multiple sugar transport system substrate-binding protein
MASPAATVPFSSTIAERASGEVRLNAPASPTEQEIINEQVAKLQAAYPNITVNFEPVAAQYLEKIQTDIAAGNAADVFMVQNEYAQDFMSRDVLLSIDDFLAEDGVDTNEFYTPLIDAYTWKDNLYGLPKDWSPLAAVYDPAILEAAGGSFPADWDALRSTLQALKDASGQVALTLTPELPRFILFLYQAGGNILNPEQTALAIDSDATTQALEYFYGLYRDGLIATPADIGAEWPGDAFAKGLASIAFEGNWMFPFLDDNAPGKAFEVAELPAGPAGKGTPAFTQAFSIFAGTSNPEAAWVVVNYMTSNEGASVAAPLGLAIPPRPDMEASYLEMFPQRKPYLDSGQYATAAQYGVGGQQFMNDSNAILQSLFAGQVDVATAKQQIVDAANNDIQVGA